jgi:hypothetical protein
LDPNGRFAITSNEITATDLSIGEDAYVYRDLGTGHFSEFEHLFRTRLIGINSLSTVYATAWAVANVLDDGGDWYANASEALGCFWLWSAGAPDYRFYLRDYEDGGADQDYVAGLAAGVDYYVTAERSGGAAFAHVYSDAGRTTLIDSLAVAPPAARTYRYVLPIGSHNNGNASRRISLMVADLDLQEVPGPAFLSGWAQYSNTHHGLGV